jgi:hypothetical protein
MKVGDLVKHKSNTVGIIEDIIGGDYINVGILSGLFQGSSAILPKISCQVLTDREILEWKLTSAITCSPKINSF